MIESDILHEQKIEKLHLKKKTEKIIFHSKLVPHILHTANLVSSAVVLTHSYDSWAARGYAIASAAVSGGILLWSAKDDIRKNEVLEEQERALQTKKRLVQILRISGSNVEEV